MALLLPSSPIHSSFAGLECGNAYNDRDLAEQPTAPISPLLIQSFLNVALAQAISIQDGPRTPSQPSSSPFPALPNELIHHILNLTATAYPESRSALCLTSSWARKITLPHLRPTVILPEFEFDRKLAEVITAVPDLPKAWSSHTDATKNLWFDSYDNLETWQNTRTALLNVARKCPNVTNWAIPGECVQWLAEGSAGPLPHLAEGPDMKMTVLPGWFRQEAEAFSPDRPSSHSAFFTRVTHIHHCKFQESLDFTAFPRLSHLAIDVDPYDLDALEQLMKQLMSISTLQAVVLVSHVDPTVAIEESGAGTPVILKDMVARLRLADERFMLLREGTPDELLDGWKAETEGEQEDLWNRAMSYSQEIGLVSI